MNEYEELKVAMMNLLESNPALAKRIGESSRAIIDEVLKEETSNFNFNDSFHIRQNCAVCFCIGAAWAITKNIRQ